MNQLHYSTCSYMCAHLKIYGFFFSSISLLYSIFGSFHLYDYNFDMPPYVFRPENTIKTLQTTSQIIDATCKISNKIASFRMFADIFRNRMCANGSLCVAAYSQLDAYFIIRFWKREQITKFTWHFMLICYLPFLYRKTHSIVALGTVFGCRFRVPVCAVVWLFRFYRFYSTSVSDCVDVMTALWSLLPK